MYVKNGYLELEELGERMPSKERLEQGPVAVLECIQPIPCNPCQEACARKAIQPFQSINDTPVINMDLCNGCGNCISVCPGLAIFVVWKNYREQHGLIKLPYELLPIPEEGETVSLMDRKGEMIGSGKVVKVQQTKHNPKSRIIWVEIPKELVMEVRHIIRSKQDDK
jgi:Fe-S-cluster-containing hydrogenase component 2